VPARWPNLVRPGPALASMGERCAWISLYEAIAAGELAQVRETVPQFTGSPATSLDASGHRPVANRETRYALRSDDTDADWAEVASVDPTTRAAPSRSCG
jgi:hypothetical protein